MKISDVISYVVPFIARQLASYGNKIDWELVRKDLDERTRKLIPKEFMDDFAVSVMNKVLDVIIVIMKKEENINAVLKNLSEGKFKDVIKSISDAVKAELN